MVGWQIIYVDAGNKLRNGGFTNWRTAADAEEEAWRRAEKHNEHVFNPLDKVVNVVCAKVG
tara:strand:- start:263 stop:445 length:183 start_codon:yes stop_codon:yes gene_type:complete